MPDEIVNPRRYDGDGRRRAAAERRRRVLDVAVTSIGERGYASTTMALLAEAAGVSVEYLYKTFGDKSRLVRTLLDYVMAGDEEPTPVVRRAEVLAMMAEPDPRLVLVAYARRCAEVNARSAALLLAMAAAAPGDPDLTGIVATAEGQRRAGASAVAADIAGKGVMRLPPDEARDTIWTLNAPEVWDLTVRRSGWTASRYVSWLAGLWADALLGEPTGRPGRVEPRSADPGEPEAGPGEPEVDPAERGGGRPG